MSIETDNPYPTQRAELIALREALLAHHTPRQVGTQLEAAFRARQQRTRGVGTWLHGVGQWLAPGSAIALSLSLSTWLFFSAPPAAMVMPESRNGIASMQSDSVDAPFIALRPLAQIELEPNPRVIETSVPKVMLAELGIAVNPEVAGEQISAQMMVSAAGQPLAVRFKPLQRF